MADYTATVPSSWSQDQTYAFMADFRNVATWDPSIERSTLLSGSGGELGSRYEVVTSHATFEYELVEQRAPEHLVFRAETSSVVSTDTITVAADGAVTYHAQMDLKGVRKVADPIAEVVLTRASDKARDGLEQKLASAL